MRSNIACIIALILLALLVNCLPWERESSGITEVLSEWGSQQSETSDRVTKEIVDDVEGSLVNSHEVDGSNWSIPNILRHWALGD